MNNHMLAYTILSGFYDLLDSDDLIEILRTKNISEEFKIIFINKYLTEQGKYYKYIKSELNNYKSDYEKRFILENLFLEPQNKLIPPIYKDIYIDRLIKKQTAAIKIVTMQKNEAHLLVHWILYYIQIVGFENIIILDNGSTDKITRKVLKFFDECGINIQYRYNTEICYDAKGCVLSSASRINAVNSKLMALVDIDEFYFLNEANNISFSPEKIYNEILSLTEKIDEYNPIMRIGPCLSNIPGSYKVENHNLKKVILLSTYRHYIDGGQHLWNGKVDMPWGFESYKFPLTNIGILHFHYRPFQHQVRMTRDKLKGHVDINDPEALKNYNRPDRYMVRYLSVSASEYYKDLYSRKDASKLDIEKEWNECNLPHPYI